MPDLIRLKAFLYLATLDEVRFIGLRRHGNLPFANDPEAAGWARFNVEDAIRMAVMLALMGDDYRTSEYLAGLPAAYASKIVWNARRNLADLPHARDEPDIWIGVLVVQGPGQDAKATTEWFCETLVELASWVAAKTDNDGQQQSKPVRMFIANASEAARGVRERALEIGLLDRPNGAQ